MSDKLTCPGCNVRLSSVWWAFLEGDPCPECGNDLLSVPITAEIIQSQFRGDPDHWSHWLAAHDREVAAKVLRDAADDVMFRPAVWMTHGNHDPMMNGEAEASCWMEDRAARIESGEVAL